MHTQGLLINFSACIEPLVRRGNRAITTQSPHQQLHFTVLLKNFVQSTKPSAKTHEPRSKAFAAGFARIRVRDGGARRDRTADLLRARQALSQLSYGPGTSQLRQLTSTRLGYVKATRLSPAPREEVVGLGGFEPPTSPLSGVRSNQLSYRPNYDATDHSSPVVMPYL